MCEEPSTQISRLNYKDDDEAAEETAIPGAFYIIDSLVGSERVRKSASLSGG